MLQRAQLEHFLISDLAQVGKGDFLEQSLLALPFLLRDAAEECLPLEAVEQLLHFIELVEEQ